LLLSLATLGKSVHPCAGWSSVVEVAGWVVPDDSVAGSGNALVHGVSGCCCC